MQKRSESKGYERWIQSLIVVSFDIDEGQKVSNIAPGVLRAEKEKEISMLAFPDSNSYSEYEGIFKYLFKTKDDQYGFVCFKQKKDSENKRGYSQKSFVILTKLPFLTFFEKLSEFLVFKLLANEPQKLTEQLHKIILQSQKWPEAQPLTNYILPILDYEIKVEIPNYLYEFNGNSMIKVQNYSTNLKSKNVSLENIVNQESLLQFGRFQEVKLTDIFEDSFEELWAIWELIILNKPFVVISNNPHRSSQAVLAAISLLNPLEYGGDFYPYVTVYDSHLSELQQAQQNLVFGATNPLFLKLFANTKVSIVQLGKSKIPKHLKPLKELFIKSKVEQQKFVNQSSLRKYFYKVNCSLISLIEEYVQLQSNDLKFFNEKQFLKYIKKREGETILNQMFDGRKYVYLFWQQFIKTLNFSLLLRSRNIVRQKC